MARSLITRVTCDRCGCICLDAAFGTIEVDVRLDEQEQVELCVRCLTQELISGLKALSVDARRGWVQIIRGRPSV